MTTGGKKCESKTAGKPGTTPPKWSKSARTQEERVLFSRPARKKERLSGKKTQFAQACQADISTKFSSGGVPQGVHSSNKNRSIKISKAKSRKRHQNAPEIPPHRQEPGKGGTPSQKVQPTSEIIPPRADPFMIGGGGCPFSKLPPTSTRREGNMSALGYGPPT